VPQEREGPDRLMKDVCPLQCRRHPGGRASASDQIEWAGLPINLDFAFSREQRDKVYAQHVMRRQGSRLRRSHDGVQPCVCEVAAEGTLGPDEAESMSSR
jgi:hypothetical protein